MTWVPGITTLSIEDLWRGYSPVGDALSRQILDNLQDRTGYQQNNYRGGDIFTLQNAALARITQPITVEKQNVGSASHFQPSDLLNRGSDFG